MTNEQAKQEAIKKAYGNFYSMCKPDSLGWGEAIGVSPDKYDLRGSCEIRPKSLKGIEDNNGWIRIEPDGSNLPKSGKYKWILGSGLIYEETFDPKSPIHVKEFLYAYTQYKPITLELKPIY